MSQGLLQSEQLESQASAIEQLPAASEEYLQPDSFSPFDTINQLQAGLGNAVVSRTVDEEDDFALSEPAFADTSGIGNAAVNRTMANGERESPETLSAEPTVAPKAYAESAPLDTSPKTAAKSDRGGASEGKASPGRSLSILQNFSKLVSRVSNATRKPPGAAGTKAGMMEGARESSIAAAETTSTPTEEHGPPAASTSPAQERGTPQPPLAEAPETAAGGLQGKSSEQTFSVFTRSTATQIASGLSLLGPQVGLQFNDDRTALTDDSPSVIVSIPGAAGPADGAGPAEPAALPSVEAVALEPAEDVTEIPQDETNVPQQPSGNSVSTDIGAAPKFRSFGEADPDRMTPVAEKAKETAGVAKQAISDEIAANSSADRIVTVSVDRAERIEMPESTANAPTEATAEMLEYLQTDVPGDVRATADADFAPLLESSLAGPRQLVQDAANQRDTERQSAFDEAQAEADSASAEAQTEQQQAIADGRAQVEEEKQKGLAEGQAKLAEFDDEVQARHAGTREEIDRRITDEQARADTAVTDGETKARIERENAEKEAKRKEDEVRRDKPAKKKNRWGRLTSWFKKALNKWKNKLKSVVKDVFAAAKTAVKGILDAAKKVATGIIRALRTVVVGMIKTFAAGLKVLVGALLVFFPKLRDRVNAAIDSVVEAAVEIVAKVAQALEDKGVALIDKVQSAVNRIIDIFETAVLTAIDLAEALLTGNFMDAAMILFLAACKTVGIPGEEFIEILKDARGALLDIIKKPAAFLGSLLKSVSKGFSNFMANFRQHFIGGITGWLFGKLAEGGITLPKIFSLKSVFSLLLQVLGFTYDYIRGKVVSIVGERNVAVIEQVMGHIKTLLTEGPAAIWEWIKDQAGQIKQKIIDAVSEWLITQLIIKAATKLATMFTPVGAFVQAVLMMYNTIMFFVERIKQIFELVKSITSSFTRIAKGMIDAAADWIERSMARAIPLIIAFLARLIGLGGIGAKVKAVVTKLRQPIDKAIEFVIGKIVGFAKRVWAGVTGAHQPDATAAEDVSEMNADERKAAAKSHVERQLRPGMELSEIEPLLQPARQKYRLSIVQAEDMETQNPVIAYYASDPLKTPLNKILKAEDVEGDPRQHPRYIDRAINVVGMDYLNRTFLLYESQDDSEGGKAFRLSFDEVEHNGSTTNIRITGKVFASRSAAEAELAKWNARPDLKAGAYAFFVRGGYVFPTTLSSHSAPRISAAVAKHFELKAKEAEEVSTALKEEVLPNYIPVGVLGILVKRARGVLRKRDVTGTAVGDDADILWGEFRGRRVRVTTSRINVRKGSPNTKGSGLEYAWKNHGGSGPASKSQFSVSKEVLEKMLGRRDVINSPIRQSGTTGNYIREVDIGDVIGRLPTNKGGERTRVITVITDVKGNLVNVFPGTLGRGAALP